MDISNRTQTLLNGTFKHQGWFKHAESLGANPVFLGYDLISFFNGSDCPMNLALMSMEMTGELHCWELLDSLKKAKHFDEESAEYSIEQPSITLNIWEALKRDERSKVTSFEKLFKQDSTTLRTAILYYNGGAGKLKKLAIKNHTLPWDHQYRVPLPLCQNVYRKKRSLEWTFALYVKEENKALRPGNSSLLLGNESIFAPDGPLDPDTVKLVQPLLQQGLFATQAHRPADDMLE